MRISKATQNLTEPINVDGRGEFMVPGVKEHGQHSPKQSQTGYDRQHDEPEPEDRIDLLVNDVERHHAQRVVLLYGARRTVLVKDALGHLKERKRRHVIARIHERVS